MPEEIITRDQPMDADMAKYHEPQPYPVPVNLSPDKERGRLLKYAYAGPNSEMTALSQYVVHHESLMPEYAAISHDILQIGIVEMLHLDMLGSCLVQFGIAPTLYAGSRPWTAQYDKYGNSPRERILLDIQGERDCIAQYKVIMQRIRHEAIENLLARIIADEELHIKLFEEMLTKL
jgi:bacterioferritin